MRKESSDDRTVIGILGFSPVAEGYYWWWGGGVWGRRQRQGGRDFVLGGEGFRRFSTKYLLGCWGTGGWAGVEGRNKWCSRLTGCDGAKGGKFARFGALRLVGKDQRKMKAVEMCQWRL